MECMGFLKGFNVMKKLLNLFFLFVFYSCYSQDYQVPKNILPIAVNNAAIKNSYSSYQKEAFDLTSVLPKDFVKNGTKDYTNFLQQGINKYSVVLMPNFPVLVNDTGLVLRSNMILLFQPQSKIILAPSYKDTYNILNLEQINNVQIFNANISGDANQHKGKGGEWGMGIAIRSSSNIKIYNALIENCWGDGIYVGQVWSKGAGGKSRVLSESKDVEIYNSLVNRNRRNGLSLVAIDGVKVYNSTFSNSYGTFPKSGIDIEPGPGITTNIIIQGCLTYGNSARGIDIMTRKLSTLAKNNIQLSIIDHTDRKSAIGIRFAGFKSDLKNQKVIRGNIVVKNPKLFNNRITPIDFETNQQYAPKIVVSSPQTDAHSNAVKYVKEKMKKAAFTNNIEIR